ncbi:hypothetical protein SHIRM173S_10361 [Streptomyces hirsutus]
MLQRQEPPAPVPEDSLRSGAGAAVRGPGAAGPGASGLGVSVLAVPGIHGLRRQSRAARRPAPRRPRGRAPPARRAPWCGSRPAGGTRPRARAGRPAWVGTVPPSGTGFVAPPRPRGASRRGTSKHEEVDVGELRPPPLQALHGVLHQVRERLARGWRPAAPGAARSGRACPGRGDHDGGALGGRRARGVTGLSITGAGSSPPVRRAGPHTASGPDLARLGARLPSRFGSRPPHGAGAPLHRCGAARGRPAEGLPPGQPRHRRPGVRPAQRLRRRRSGRRCRAPMSACPSRSARGTPSCSSPGSTWGGAGWRSPPRSPCSR